MSSQGRDGRCAFLTMDDSAGWAIDADLAIPHLHALGWQVDEVRWRRSDVAWADYDAVYIGTPWDYPLDPDRFLVMEIELIEPSLYLHAARCCRKVHRCV